MLASLEEGPPQSPLQQYYTGELMAFIVEKTLTTLSLKLKSMMGTEQSQSHLGRSEKAPKTTSLFVSLQKDPAQPSLLEESLFAKHYSLRSLPGLL